MKIAAATAFLIILTGLTSSMPANATPDRPWATIGTGAVTGVYYNSGQAIAKTLDRYARDLQIVMSVKETQGSLENLDAVTSGRFYFSIIQSDLQYKAWNGSSGSPWAGKPQKNLRAVFNLYTEAINLVVLSNLKIQRLQDLSSKRVNLGELGSGQYINSHDLLEAVGLNPRKDLSAVNVSPTMALDLFVRRKIDAFFFTAGHPAAQFHEIAGGGRRAKFIALEVRGDLLEKYPYYKRTSIPISYYPDMDNDRDVPTIGVTATVVASSDTPDWMAYGIVKTVSENMAYFKTQLLVFQDMDRTGMLEGLSAPIHPGALKYYHEVGLSP